MARNGMLSIALGVMLGATAVYAQDDLEMQMVRFEPSVQVLALEQGGLTVEKPGKAAEAAVCYKAYPYGSTFTVAEGVKCRLRFSDLSFAVVTGPAVVKPMAADMFRKVILDVTRGDFNLSVDQRAQAGQFTVLTPMWISTSMPSFSRVMACLVSNTEVTVPSKGANTLPSSGTTPMPSPRMPAAKVSSGI